MDAIARWWDGVELWIAGLPFVPQVILVVSVMLPLCFFAATVLDKMLAPIVSRVERKRRQKRTRGSEREGEVGGDAQI
ncbi:hypothetical protein ONR57_18450 [Hoyosella sp. YIM 151337]|uniref:hypothetical protein n=1 Tax=Hoyosella sp. YIM 151337 TaxID=2992742 RepID=UPI0022362774|nr:hypothetical protein [Hoyosella sp. YIM 151337]MCW4355289.1 hypothetical protein [Hoyosella sp. YIM 151337]